MPSRPTVVVNPTSLIQLSPLLQPPNLTGQAEKFLQKLGMDMGMVVVDGPGSGNGTDGVGVASYEE